MKHCRPNKCVDTYSNQYTTGKFLIGSSWSYCFVSKTYDGRYSIQRLISAPLPGGGAGRLVSGNKIEKVLKVF